MLKRGTFAIAPRVSLRPASSSSLTFPLLFQQGFYSSSEQQQQQQQEAEEADATEEQMDMKPKKNEVKKKKKRREDFEISPKTKEMLTRLLYHEHHRPKNAEKDRENRNKINSEGWYDAKVELGWITEWANDIFHKDPRVTEFFSHPTVLPSSSNNNNNNNTSPSKQQLEQEKEEEKTESAEGEAEEEEDEEPVAEPKEHIVSDLLKSKRRPLPKVIDDHTFHRAVEFAVLERVDLHKPLSLILGSQPFCGTDIECVRSLMQPRIETEEWVSFVINKFLKKTFSPRMIPVPGPWKIGATTIPYTQRYVNADDDVKSVHDRPRGTERFRVLDLCSGTGCIGAALLRHFPTWVEIVGADVNPLAVEVSLRNYRRAYRTGLIAAGGGGDVPLPPDSAQFLDAANAAAPLSGIYSAYETDMFSKLPEDYRGSFDLILSNPPYLLEEEYKTAVPKSVKDFEDKTCLVGDERHCKDGAISLLYFKELRDESPLWLKSNEQQAKDFENYKGPRLGFELGLQASIVRNLFAENFHWGACDIFDDMFGEKRFVLCGLTSIQERRALEREARK